MPKYVVSTTLEDPAWNNTTVIDGDVAGRSRGSRSEVDGDILVNGSARSSRALVEHDLVDEYRLMVFPVVLGRGKRLSARRGRERLRLVESKPVGDDGVVILIYRRAGDGS